MGLVLLPDLSEIISSQHLIKFFSY